MSDSLTVHIILNSHLDPVWLWHKSQGIDAVLGTARSACNILDDCPDVFMTRGEAWFYEMVQSIDPDLFKRIQDHVNSGRWNVVGGWYVQPDCNLAPAGLYRKHSEYCGKWFRDNLNVKVKTAYHVDSFGHAATMPDFLSEGGFDNYVMMRPGIHEMRNPPDTLFDWISPSGNKVRTFRIARCYATASDERYIEKSVVQNIEWAVSDAASGASDTMCFIGFGDHGGGPGYRAVKWIQEHLDYRPGVRLEFSTPDRFFEAVKRTGYQPQQFSGELQHHAIGCYSAVSKMKQQVRKTFELLDMAEHVKAESADKGAPDFTPEWKKLMFNTFHDLLPGSSICSAYEQAFDELGSARWKAREYLQMYFRRETAKLPPCPQQRLFFDNPSGQMFDGWYEFEPWVEEGRKDFLFQFELRDEQDNLVPYQQIPSPASFTRRLIAKLRIPPSGRRTLRICQIPGRPGSEIAVPLPDSNQSGLAELKYSGTDFLSDPVKAVWYHDYSDTWSHNMASYSTVGGTEFSASQSAWHIDFAGPLVSQKSMIMYLPEGELCYRIRTFSGEFFTELHLQMNWNSVQKIVKLEISPRFHTVKRIDAIPDALLERPLDGEEYPALGFVMLCGENGQTLTAASPDFTSADVQPDGTLRITLLRSPYYAHHLPVEIGQNTPMEPTGQGIHHYRIRLIPSGKPLTEADRERILSEMDDPVFFSETTYGIQPL